MRRLATTADIAGVIGRALRREKDGVLEPPQDSSTVVFLDDVHFAEEVSIIPQVCIYSREDSGRLKQQLLLLGSLLPLYYCRFHERVRVAERMREEPFLFPSAVCLLSALIDVDVALVSVPRIFTTLLCQTLHGTATDISTATLPSVPWRGPKRLSMRGEQLPRGDYSGHDRWIRCSGRD